MTTPPVDPPPPQAGDLPNGEAGPPPGPEAGPARPSQAWLGLIGRVARSFRAFFAAHLIVAQNEAEREISRIATGVGLFIGAVMFMLATAMLFAVGTVVLLQRVTGLPWLESLGIAMLVTLTIALVLGGLGWWRVNRPLMPQTRALLERTLDGLR